MEPGEKEEKDDFSLKNNKLFLIILTIGILLFSIFLSASFARNIYLSSELKGELYSGSSLYSLTDTTPPENSPPTSPTPTSTESPIPTPTESPITTPTTTPTTIESPSPAPTSTTPTSTPSATPAQSCTTASDCPDKKELKGSKCVENSVYKIFEVYKKGCIDKKCSYSNPFTVEEKFQDCGKVTYKLIGDRCMISESNTVCAGGCIWCTIKTCLNIHWSYCHNHHLIYDKENFCKYDKILSSAKCINSETQREEIRPCAIYCNDGFLPKLCKGDCRSDADCKAGETCQGLPASSEIPWPGTCKSSQSSSRSNYDTDISSINDFPEFEECRGTGSHVNEVILCPTEVSGCNTGGINGALMNCCSAKGSCDEYDANGIPLCVSCERVDVSDVSPRCIPSAILVGDYLNPIVSTTSTSIYMIRNNDSFTFDGKAYIIKPHMVYNKPIQIFFNFSYYPNSTNFLIYRYYDQDAVLKVCNSSLLEKFSRRINSDGGVINLSDEIIMTIPNGALSNATNMSIESYLLSDCFNFSATSNIPSQGKEELPFYIEDSFILIMGVLVIIVFIVLIFMIVIYKRSFYKRTGRKSHTKTRRKSYDKVYKTSRFYISELKKMEREKFIFVICFFSLILAAGLASASDVAYIYKNKVDDNIIDYFSELNLKSDLIEEKNLPSDLSNYKFIFVGDENFANELPVDKYPSVIINYDDVKEMGLSNSNGASKLVSTTPLEVKFKGKKVKVYSSSKDNMGFSIPYYYLDEQNKVSSLKEYVGTYSTSSGEDFGDVIAFADKGDILGNGNSSEGGICFFGIVRSEYWTDDAKGFFRDCIKHVYNFEASCHQDSDCGADGESGDAFCSNNNIVKKYNYFKCLDAGTDNSYCSSETNNKIIQTCSDICSNGECKDVNCMNTNECDDGNSSTEDICKNPGTLNSICIHNIYKNITDLKLVSLIATSTTTSVSLNFAAVPENKSVLKGYLLKMNSDGWIFVDSNALSYTFTGLNSSTNYIFYAKAIDNTNKSSDELNVSVRTLDVPVVPEPVIVPVSSGGGGGGGISGSFSYCKTKWECAEWGECIQGEQTRKCSYPKDKCKPELDKPIEIRSCIEMPSITPTNIAEENKLFNENVPSLNQEEAEETKPAFPITGAAIANVAKNSWLWSGVLIAAIAGIVYQYFRRK